MNNLDNALLLRKSSRRQMLKNLGMGAAGLAAVSSFAAVPPPDPLVTSLETTSPFPIVGVSAHDLAILDFALNLEYLEANFYSYAVSGVGLSSQSVAITGRGTQGTVTVPTTTMVPFSDPNVLAYATEIAKDEIEHVKFLRGIVEATGHVPVAQPAIDLVNSFNAASNAAGLGSTFNPFANDLNFLLGAFIFEDVGVTAYHGAIASILNKNTMKYAAGIMGTEGYHASEIRTLLYGMGSAAQSAANAISAARASLGGGMDAGITVNGVANITPVDADGLVFARTPAEVLNIVYLSPTGAPGGFFPNGINA